MSKPGPSPIIDGEGARFGARRYDTIRRIAT
jgi:hypothetical protein